MRKFRVEELSYFWPRFPIDFSAPVHHVLVRCSTTFHYKASSCHTQQNVFTVVQNVPTSVYCATSGGYPPPGVSVFLGSRDITDMFQTSSLDSVLRGSRGLRQMIYMTNLSTDSMSLKSTDDGILLRCSATVPGLAPTHADVIIRVNCESLNEMLTVSNASEWRYSCIMSAAICSLLVFNSTESQYLLALVTTNSMVSKFHPSSPDKCSLFNRMKLLYNIVCLIYHLYNAYCHVCLLVLFPLKCPKFPLIRWIERQNDT